LRSCDKHILKTLELVDIMIDLADKGDAAREDTGCGILYGVLRDTAYKLRKLAQEEKNAHIKKGLWQEKGQVVSEYPAFNEKDNITKKRRR
jgi:hypothetical protein